MPTMESMPSENSNEVLPVAPPVIEIPKNPEDVKRSAKEAMEYIEWHNAVQKAKEQIEREKQESEVLPVAPPIIEIPKNPEDVKKSGEDTKEAIEWENAVQEAARKSEKNIPVAAAGGAGGPPPPDDPNNADPINNDYYRSKILKLKPDIASKANLFNNKYEEQKKLRESKN